MAKINDDRGKRLNKLKKGESTEPKLNTVQKQGLITEIGQMIIDGSSRTNIVETIKRHAPVPLGDSYCAGLIVQARQTIEQESAQSATAVIGVHVSIYEDIFNYFHEVECAPGVNKALKQKEKLLQLHKEDNTLVINNRKKTTIVRKEPEYDVSKLNSTERKRMDELLKKASSK